MVGGTGEQEGNSYKRTDSQDLKEIKTRGYAALGFLVVEILDANMYMTISQIVHIYSREGVMRVNMKI